MDLIKELKAFVATAQTGSFTTAGEHLNLSNRLTSKYVAELETRLGVRLFQRTTRKVGLTPAGEELLARAPALLDELDEMLASITDDQSGFSGLLRISAPMTLGEIYVKDMLKRFAESHPNLTIDLRLDDTYVDLARDGIDLAFRVGITDTLSAKVRKLGETKSYVVASPKYLSKYGHPKAPQDLMQHSCIIDKNRRSPWRWVFHDKQNEIWVNVKGNFLVNSMSVCRDLAIADQGVAYCSKFAICDALDSGELIILLENYKGEQLPFSAVYLEGRKLPRKVRALIEFAQSDVKQANIL